MKKTLNIVFDLEGVLYDVEAFMYKYAVNFFKDKYNLEIVNKNRYGIKEIFNCTDEQESEFWTKHALKYFLLYKPRQDVVEAISGQECIDKIKNGQQYDLILLDDMMPKLSGTETLKQLKKNNGFSIPTVAFTANAITGMREKYIAEGFDDYLSKPIQKEELNIILKKFLNK